MKQTAVEWLFEKYVNKSIITIEDIEQAKAIEKEQMKYFIQVGYYAHSQGHKKDEKLYNYWIDNYKK